MVVSIQLSQYYPAPLTLRRCCPEAHTFPAGGSRLLRGAIRQYFQNADLVKCDQVAGGVSLSSV
jgi:hypothetical protein